MVHLAALAGHGEMIRAAVRDYYIPIDSKMNVSWALCMPPRCIFKRFLLRLLFAIIIFFSLFVALVSVYLASV